MRKKSKTSMLVLIMVGFCSTAISQPATNAEVDPSVISRDHCLQQNDVREAINFVRENLRDSSANSIIKGAEPLNKLQQVDSSLGVLNLIIGRCASKYIYPSLLSSNIDETLQLLRRVRLNTSFILERKKTLEDYHLAVVATREHGPEIIRLGRQLTEVRKKEGMLSSSTLDSEPLFEDLSLLIMQRTEQLASERDISVETVFYLHKYSESFLGHLKSVRHGGSPGRLDYMVKKASGAQMPLLSKIESNYDQSFSLWLKLFANVKGNQSIANFVAAKDAAFSIELSAGKLALRLEEICDCPDASVNMQISR